MVEGARLLLRQTRTPRYESAGTVVSGSVADFPAVDLKSQEHQISVDVSADSPVRSVVRDICVIAPFSRELWDKRQHEETHSPCEVIRDGPEVYRGLRGTVLPSILSFAKFKCIRRFLYRPLRLSSLRIKAEPGADGNRNNTKSGGRKDKKYDLDNERLTGHKR